MEQVEEEEAAQRNRLQDNKPSLEHHEGPINQVLQGFKEREESHPWVERLH